MKSKSCNHRLLKISTIIREHAIQVDTFDRINLINYANKIDDFSNSLDNRVCAAYQAKKYMMQLFERENNRMINESTKVKTNSIKQVRNSVSKFLKKFIDSSQLVLHSTFDQPDPDQMILKLSIFGGSRKSLNDIRKKLSTHLNCNDFDGVFNEDHSKICEFIKDSYQIKINPVNRAYRSGKGFERETTHLGIEIIGPKHFQSQV